MTQHQALEILKTGANIFITGEPGSGKTYLINQYVAWLRAHGIAPAITASTGIAATHIGGMTIHSWSGIGIKTELTKYDMGRIKDNSRGARRIKNARVLIIDEISMLSARTFEMVDTVCRVVRGSQKPFGGLQVVLVGDFFQLPPIVRRNDEPDARLGFENNSANANAQFAYASSAWMALNPMVCYLSEQHRQEDMVFLGILSAFRSGTLDESHIGQLSARRSSGMAAHKGITKLFSHNADVDRVNEREIELLPNEAHIFTMASHGQAKLVEQLKHGCLSPENLQLKIGAKVMFTKNNPEGKFVNGTMGTIVGFQHGDSEFSSADFPVVETMAGKRIVAEPMDWNIENEWQIVASITQVPLRLAWAITVHKSQGMSLDAAVIDLSQAFEYGQGYVAVSRVRTLAGLHLLGLNARALEVHPDILVKDAEFRAASEDGFSRFSNLTARIIEDAQRQFISACGGKDVPVASSNVATDIPKTYSVEKLREKYINAYSPWTKEDDEDLLRRHEAGETTKEIAIALGRNPGAINSRLAKLGF